MRRLRHSLFNMTLLLIFVTALTFTAAADDSKEQIFTDPAKAGPEYPYQGEYSGEIKVEERSIKVGGQVIALGKKKFRFVGYLGGLPGDGWRRESGKRTSEGELKGDSIDFEGENDAIRMSLKGKSIAIKNKDGKVFGELKKIERKSPTLGAKPPKGSIVLFDGKSADKFVRGKIVKKNLLLNNCESKETFGDHTLHIEFRTPFKPLARGQARGNSGVYVQSRYEIQVLDSFGLEGKNNECGGIYSIAEPAVNMCYPPLTWQTYDIDFTAAKYDDKGKKTSNARITIRHNGVVIHDNIELKNGTPGKSAEGPKPLGLYLQGHGNPVHYRNIWAIKK